MEREDWVVLFFPILCNGVFLFVFTQLIEAKINRKQLAQNAHQKLLHEFLGMTKKILQIYCAEDEDSILQSLNVVIPLFFSFSVKNKESLQEYTQNIESVAEIWEQLVTVLNYVQDNEDGVIIGENSKKVSFLVDKLFDVSVEISQKCISDIYERGEYAI